MTFGELLKLYIKKSGHTIYAIAKLSGINRTSLQKILSNDRKPNLDFLAHIVPHLNLTPEEYQELHKLFIITLAGRVVFERRQMVFSMLRNFSNLHIYQPYSPPQGDAPLTYREPGLVQGAYNIMRVLTDSLDTAYRCPHPEVYMNLPGTLTLTVDFLRLCVNMIDDVRCIEINHITSMLKNPEDTAFPAMNLNTLSRLFPYILNRYINYNLYYYYETEPSINSVNSAFPYYIVFPELIILVSARGESAMLCRQKKAVSYFLNLFEAARTNCHRLTNMWTLSTDLLENMLKLDSEKHSYHTLEFQPCLFTFMTDEMIRTYTNPQMQNYRFVVQSLMLRRDQLAAHKSRICLFNPSGLEYFASTGNLLDFPSPMGLPLSLEDRAVLLHSLYKNCQEERCIYRTVNPIAFPLEPSLICTCRGDHNVEFIYQPKDSSKLKYIFIEEGTIIHAFQDFFQYAVNSSLVCSKEATLDCIRNCIQMCTSEK